MKRICSVGLMVLIAACSSHPIKCHGPLRPINTATTGATGTELSQGAKPAQGSKPAQGETPAPTDPQP